MQSANSQNMHIHQLDYAQIRDSFFLELQNAVTGKQTSLPFIRNPLPDKPLITEGVFQAMVIGGTHYESIVAQLHKDGSLTPVSDIHQNRLPLLTTVEIFLQTIQKHIIPGVNIISLNLAFPVQPMMRHDILDGKLEQPGKGHYMTGLVGKPVGETIEQFIKKSENRTLRVIVANDTICLALAGLKELSADRKNMVSIVVGSGFNMAFFLDKNHIINLESGDFNRFIPSATGKAVDDKSSNQGRSLYEKEVSGLYLFHHYNILKQQFNLPSRDIRDGEELSEIAASGAGQEAVLARELLQRSASLVAAQIAGLYLFKNKPEQLQIIVEGSVFKKGWHYEQMVYTALEKLSIPANTVQFLHIQNSSLGGAVSLITICRI